MISKKKLFLSLSLFIIVLVAFYNNGGGESGGRRPSRQRYDFGEVAKDEFEDISHETVQRVLKDQTENDVVFNDEQTVYEEEEADGRDVEEPEDDERGEISTLDVTREEAANNTDKMPPLKSNIDKTEETKANDTEIIPTKSKRTKSSKTPKSEKDEETEVLDFFLNFAKKPEKADENEAKVENREEVEARERIEREKLEKAEEERKAAQERLDEYERLLNSRRWKRREKVVLNHTDENSTCLENITMSEGTMQCVYFAA